MTQASSWSECRYSSCEVGMWGDCLHDGEDMEWVSRRAAVGPRGQDEAFYAPDWVDDGADESHQPQGDLDERDMGDMEASREMLGSPRAYTVRTYTPDCEITMTSRVYPG